MTNLSPKPEWPNVRQLEQTDRAIAGQDGVMNAQAQALLNRTEYLNNEKASNEDVKNLENKTSALGQVKADKDYVDNKVSAISNGRVGSYTTYEKAVEKQDTWPPNSSITITNDPNDIKNGEYTWDGVVLKKSAYDPLEKSKRYTDERLPRAHIPAIYPVVVDNKGNIPIWIENGEIGLTQLTPKSVIKVADQVGIGALAVSNILPIVVDSKGNIPIWIENGMFNFAAMHPNALKKTNINSALKSNNTTKAAFPIVSDSASLRQWKAKVANLKSGLEQQLRIVLTGDSWTEHNTISKELISLLRGEYGEAGGGWINLGAERNMLDSIQITYSVDWVVNDLNIASASFPYGCAPDGFTRTSTTVGASITLSNLEKGDVLTAFFGKTNCTFTYSLNSSAEIEVSADAEKLEINLTEKSSITFKLKSGELVFFGFHLRKTTGSGVEFNRLGNGGAAAQDYLKISPHAQEKFADFFSPDVLIIILGTNDYRIGHSVENYKLGISAIIDGFKSKNQNCGVILIAPAKSGAKAAIELSKYRDAVYELAIEKKCEFYNMYDDWGEYQTERYELKQWVDSAHVSKSGACRLSKTIFKNFLEL